MNMFSEPAGNLLQLLALGMEFVGISLAAIELRFPRLAAGLVAYQADIVRTPADQIKGSPGDIEKGRWLEVSLKDMYLQKHLEEGRRTRPVVDSMKFIGFCWVSGTLLALLVGSFRAIFETDLGTLLLLYLLPVAVLAVTPLLIYLAARIVFFTRTFSEGRGIGTLGLLIAFAGLLLELYQVITVALSDQPSIGEAPYGLKMMVGTAGMMLFVFAVYIVVVARKITRDTD
jgi:hypothetical protein